MKVYTWLLAIMTVFALRGYAQPDSTEAPAPLPEFTPGELLGPYELQEEKFFDNLEDALSNPEKVYKLSLAGQKLKQIPAEVFALSNLQVLILSENKIKFLPEEIGQLKNLQLLSLYDNKLRTVPDDFRELENLSTLYLGRNRLTELPIWMGGIGQLRRLDISRNPMTPLEITYIRNMLGGVEISY